jgi:pseudouridylate synthase
MMPHVPGSFDSTAEAASPVVASLEVANALADGTPVVALESTLLAHGLPTPRNRTVANELEAAVRAHGAVPATVAVLDGRARVGLSPAELDRVCGGGLAKLSVRDLGVAVGLRRDGATTVAATAALAAAAGIAVFATGGLGGVHREARESWDVSADLAALALTPVLVVCSGVKSILDVAATLEVL